MHRVASNTYSGISYRPTAVGLRDDLCNATVNVSLLLVVAGVHMNSIFFNAEVEVFCGQGFWRIEVLHSMVNIPGKMGAKISSAGDQKFQKIALFLVIFRHLFPEKSEIIVFLC